MPGQDNETDVVVSVETIEKSINDFNELFSDMDEKKTTMAEKDQSLYSAWFGTAGDTFKLASYSLENGLGDLITRQQNAAAALDQTNQRFSSTDSTLQNDIETNTSEGG